MQTLRSRLILSHLLPLLTIVPLIGLTIFYLLETQQQLAALSSRLTQQAQSVAQSTRTRPDIWSDTDLAQLFIEVISDQLGPNTEVNVQLIRPGGQLLATNDPEDRERVGQQLEIPEMTVVMSEEEGYLSLRADLASVLVPVVEGEQVLGLVSLTTELDSVTTRLLRLRFLLIGALVVELLLGIGVGLILALNFERDLQAVTKAVGGISSGELLEMLPERGPAEFRALARAYNRMVQRLQTLEEARRQLLANTVHEVGRPLGALRSAIQALLQGADEDPVFRRELLEGMDAQVERLHPLLNNLAEMHGQVLGVLELARRSTPLATWLRQVAAPWQAAAREKGVQWQAEIPDSLPTMKIDPDRLAQAVGNLLSNAVKYTPPQGVVTVKAGVAETAVFITVSDTGPGIVPEEQQQVFDPFYRSRQDTRFPQGMGLGLTITRDLVHAHGGRLELESVPGEGSQFSIYLPLLKYS